MQFDGVGLPPMLFFAAAQFVVYLPAQLIQAALVLPDGLLGSLFTLLV